MTGLSLRNPIMILMLCIGVIVFAGVVTPRMPIDTFPELTPPVLIIGTLAPGLGPKDVEKTISWRRGLISTDRCRRPGRALDSEELATIDRFLLLFEGEL